MTSLKRKILSIIAGVLFFLLGCVVAFIGQFYIAGLGDILIAKDSLPNWTMPIAPKNFYFFFVLSISLSAGLSVTTLFWHYRPQYRVRKIVYVILLFTILPIAMYNYAHADYLINRSAQSLFNICIIFLGTIVVLELVSFKSSAKDLLVLQIISIFLLGMTAVFIPAMFTIVWLLNTLGVVSKSGSDLISLPALSTIAGLLSAAISYIKFRKETKTDKANIIIK